jgi:hypothetical protein
MYAEMKRFDKPTYPPVAGIDCGVITEAWSDTHPGSGGERSFGRLDGLRLRKKENALLNARTTMKKPPKIPPAITGVLIYVEMTTYWQEGARTDRCSRNQVWTEER